MMAPGGSTSHHSRTIVRRLVTIALLLTGVAVGVGCTYGTLPGDSEGDAGISSPDGTSADGTSPDVDMSDAGVDVAPKPWDKTDDSAFTICGGAGVSSGDGVRAIQCYGPTEASGATPSGSTNDGTSITWQPGAFRVTTP